MEIDPQEMEICLKVLQQVADTHRHVSKNDRFLGLISKIARDGKRYTRDQKSAQERDMIEKDREVMAQTAMVQIQRDAVSAAALPLPGEVSNESAGSVRRLNQPENCYICKEPYTEVHFFYHLLCPRCATYNYRMRHLTADLRGRTALVTGGRVKIGHETVLRLLRDGAKVIVVTRFPSAAAKRLHGEPDSADWIDRVRCYGLDLRNIPAVEEFARYLLNTESHLDILIHNAAQTIRRPDGFYQALMDQELHPEETISREALRLVAHEAPSTISISDSARLLPAVMKGVDDAAMVAAEAQMDILPTDSLEDNEERADSRNMNSWLLKLDEVSAPEMLEVQLVNSVAPFILNSRLKPLLMRSPHERRFIVNVSAMEGQFSRHKTVFHPHTNMAKAALNMMTRTSGDDYAQDRIYMNSVDTGWVTDENPTPKRLRNQNERGFFAPLDIIDGMARIYHPVAEGINDAAEPLYGKFLKDYVTCPW